MKINGIISSPLRGEEKGEGEMNYCSSLSRTIILRTKPRSLLVILNLFQNLNCLPRIMAKLLYRGHCACPPQAESSPPPVFARRENACPACPERRRGELVEGEQSHGLCVLMIWI